MFTVTDSQSRWTSAFPSTGECCSFCCWSQEKDEALPGLELKCIEENEEDQLAEGIVIVEALSGKKFNISSNAGLIRSRKNLLLLKQSSDAKWTIPATYHDWQLGKYWKHCWTESQSISNLTQLSSFDNWTGNMAQFCHKAHSKNSPKHSKILQVHGSKGIAKTTGYRIMKFTPVLHRHKKLLCCSVPQKFFSPILRAYLSANLTANFLLFFLFM